MQKKLIALAVAALASGAAFAQTNVTIYGVADVHMNYQTGKDDNADNQKRYGVDSGGLSGSRIGFKGTEDLGNGLKGLFTLEYMVMLDENVGLGNGGTQTGVNTRQAFVGLTGGFGTAVAGRLQTHSYNAVNAYAPGIAAIGAYGAHGAVAAEAGFNQTGSLRLNNAVAYVSPVFAGFNFGASYSFDPLSATQNEQTSSASRGRAFEVAANFNQGPVSVGYVYADIRQQSAAVAARQGFDSAGNFFAAGAQAAGTTALIPAIEGSDAETASLGHHFLGGSYDFGVAKLKATYQTQKTKVGGETVQKGYIWSAGVDVPVMAKGKVQLGYVAFSDQTPDADQTDVQAYTLGYVHELSKRTKLYTAYTRLSNDDAANAGIVARGATPSVGNSASILGLGVNHSF